VPHVRHLPLVDLLVDTRTELLELAIRSGMKVFGSGSDPPPSLRHDVGRGPEVVDTYLKARHVEHERLKKAGHIVPQVLFRKVAEGRGGETKLQRIVSFAKAWRSACGAAGCPGRIPHDLRRPECYRLLDGAGQCFVTPSTRMSSYIAGGILSWRTISSLNRSLRRVCRSKFRRTSVSGILASASLTDRSSA
jgi:hypothetical protein